VHLQGTVSGMTQVELTRSSEQARFTSAPDNETRQTLEVLRTVFLCLILVGLVFYTTDLWILGHWLESWQSHVPFLMAVPSFIFTVLMLFWRRENWVRYPFMALMLLDFLTGLTGAIFHIVWNFEGEINLSLKGIRDALEGARPVLAALAFTHIGVTGLLCSLEPPKEKIV
jgi:hypothetical protein